MSSQDHGGGQPRRQGMATGKPGAPTAGSSDTEIERDAEAAKRKAGQAADEAKQSASELGDEAKRLARDAAADVKEEARNFAEEQKDDVSHHVGGVADALRSAAGSLDDEQPSMANYARQAASGLEQVSDAISSRSLDDIVETVEDFARRQPVAFLGGAVLAGFVLSRFAKSSSERRYESGYDRAAYRPAAPAARQPLQSGGHGAGMAPTGNHVNPPGGTANREFK